ncbi:MAG: zinc ribbon domain-containing protein [Phycisphaerales bacterium]
MALVHDLLTLFRVDTQVRSLQSRVRAAERYLAAQQSRLDDLETDRAELASRIKHLRADVANAECEMATHDERIDKLRTSMNSSATQKEYTALLTEINTFKVARSELETIALEHLETIEQRSEELAAVEQQLEERARLRDLARVDLEQCRTDVAERLAELQRERERAAAVIPPHDLDAFNELAERYDGEAMAFIDVVDRRNKEYACGACNLHVTLDAVSALQGAGATISRCAACRRILFLKEEAPGAVASTK